MSPTARCVEFVVPGRAQPGGSKRAFIVQGRARVVDANKNVAAWKDRVAFEAVRAMNGRPLLEGAIELRLSICLARPKGHYTKKGLRPSAPARPTTRPDLTKYERAIEDAMTGLVWRDDSQVTNKATAKEYGDSDRVRIGVIELQ